MVGFAGPLDSLYNSYKSRLGLLLYHAGDIPQALKVLEEVFAVFAAYKQVNGISNTHSLDALCFIAGIFR